jgi:hypothetical protein
MALMGEHKGTNSIDRIEPVLEPPNGERVTTKDLKAVLYDLDVGLSERFNIVLDAIGQLREDFETHRRDGHPHTDHANIVKETLRRDAEEQRREAKKADIVARLLAVFAAFISAGTALIRWLTS